MYVEVSYTYTYIYMYSYKDLALGIRENPSGTIRGL